MKACTIGLAVLLGCAATAATAQTPPPPVDTQTAATLTYTQPVPPDGIRKVQDKLKAAGAFSGTVDGTWGPASAEALQSYQQSNGLQAIGNLNPATLATLGLSAGDLFGGAAPPPAAPPPAPTPAPAEAAAPPPPHAPFRLSDDSVRIVQSRLRQLGYYTGAVDGVWGGGTQAGMQAFERSRNLPVTDGLNSQTVSAMGIDPASMVPQ